MGLFEKCISSGGNCGMCSNKGCCPWLKELEIFANEEEKPMESVERIEITFKSGETISYGKGEWDDYAYDGKAIIVKQKGAWIGIYNFEHVFCVELKEK